MARVPPTKAMQNADASRAGVVTAAVLFTDIAGSTATRLQLGARRADNLQRAHDDIVRTAIVANGGRVVRSTGDGVKAVFAASSAALAAGLDVLRSVATYSARSDAIASLEVRVGVAVGEVTEFEGDVHGVAVVEAARVVDLATAGQLLATKMVALLAAGTAEADVVDVGEHDLKGLDTPVSLVEVTDAGRRGGPLAYPQTLRVGHRFPLVGRDHELASLRDRWQRAVDGQTASVCLSGEPGLGKSRLASHLAEVAFAEGGIVLHGSCSEHVAVPYQAMSSALGAASTVDVEVGEALDGVGPLAPMFSAEHWGSDSALGPAERTQLFSAAAEVLARLTDRGPVLLVVDDVQWATVPTLELLRLSLAQQARQEPTHGLLVVCTLRATETAQMSGERADAWHAVEQAGRMERVDLAPLTVADIADLVHTELEHVVRAHDDPPSLDLRRVADAIAPRLHRESGGGTLFACELVRHVASETQTDQLLALADGSQLELPATVHDAISDRTARLTSSARSTLLAAAVIGEEFDLDVLAELQRTTVAELLDDLEELTAASLLSELAAGRFGFTHGLVHGALYESYGETRLAHLHRTVAGLTEQLRPAAHAEIAIHFAAAGEPELALPHVLRAAERDLHAFAYESAFNGFDRCIGLLTTIGSDDASGELTRAFYGRAMAQRAMGLRAYHDDLLEAARLAETSGDVELFVDAALASVWPGIVFDQTGVVLDQFVEICERALAKVDACADSEARRIRLLTVLAGQLLFDRSPNRRRECLVEAERSARRAGDPALLGQVLAVACLDVWNPHQSTRRARIANELVAVAEAANDRDLGCFAEFALAVGLAEVGDLDAARSALDELLPRAQPPVSAYMAYLIERFIVSIDVFRGVPNVQASIDALATRYAEYTNCDTEGTWLLQTGFIAMQADRFAELINEVKAAAESTSHGWSAAYGVALVASGDLDGARKVLAELVESDIGFMWISTTLAAADVAIGVSDAARCDAIFASLEPFAGQLALTGMGWLCHGLVSATLGALAFELGRLSDAELFLEEAIMDADRIAAPHDAMRCRLLLARLILELRGDELGTVERAAVLRREADELTATHGVRAGVGTVDVG